MERFARVLLIGGFAVSAPLLVLTFAHVHGHGVSGWLKSLCVYVPSVGLALAATGGGVLAGQSIVTNSRYRFPLSALWAVILLGQVYVVGAYLIASYAGLSLFEVLRFGFLLENWPLAFFMGSVVAVPECGVVAGLVVARSAAEDRARFDAERAEQEAELVATLRSELKEARAVSEALRVEAAGGAESPVAKVYECVREDAEGPATARDIAEATGLTVSQTTRALGKLCARGDLARSGAPDGVAARFVYGLPEVPVDRFVSDGVAAGG